jgi:hypothetical protein
MLMALGNLIKAVATLMIVSIIAVVGFVGYRKYEAYLNSEKTIRDLEVKNGELEKANQKLAFANRMLKLNYQLAKIRMPDQYKDPDTGEMVSVVEFWELNEDGRPVYPDPKNPEEPNPTKVQTVRIRGKQAFIQGLAVKFDDKFVEEGDPLRGTAMFAFKSIFGENDKPSEGKPLYSKRTQPTAYFRGSKPTEFEEEIWGKFWDIANDPQRMEKLGVTALHGQSPSMELRKGNTYIVKLRSTGDVSIITQDHRKAKPWND